MKPNFALTLSFDGLALLHRAYPGWHSVGEVSFDDPDLHGALAQLRDKGLALDSAGMTSKLVIPEDQIRYLDFDPDGASGEALEQAVHDRLSGATPYAIDDLAYDWSFEAGQVHVAAVARETLDEAEEFAARYGFNPVCFVAMPANGRFVGEPWFGEAAQAQQYIPSGALLERDSAAIRIIGAAPTPSFANEPEPTPAAQPAPQPEQPPEPQPEDQPEPETATEPAPATESAEGTDSPAQDAPAPNAGEEPAPSFRSVRASRDDDPAPASRRLEGAARGLTTIAPADSAAPPVTGRPGDCARSHDAPDLRATPGDRLHTGDSDSATSSDALKDDPAAAFFTQRDAAVSSVTAAPPPPADEKQRMTIFGARESAPVGGKPRYLGLALTAALVLFLVAVAAWASVFMDDGISGLFRSKPESQIALVPAPEDSPADIDESDAGDIASDPALQPVPEPEPESAPDLASRPAAEDSPAQPELAQTPGTELSSDQLLARYAATGIWQQAPEAPSAPGLMTLDDFYQTSIDTPVRSSDAVALPAVDALQPDTAPERPADPVAPGTRFVMDERGLVVATPDGALTPQGVLVYAGRPALTPGNIPDRPSGASIATALPEAETLRLFSVRPRTRPDNLTEQNERGRLGVGGRSRAEFAALRPRTRPEGIARQQQAAADPPLIVDSEAVNAALTEAAQEPDPFASATPQAVSYSLKPNMRPGNFEKIVANTRTSDRSTPVSATQRVAPSAPTATTVARAATEQNAISLRQVNLIGVYGSPSNRRALVRLANGRYQKVQVGDKLDGGQVAAIGESELRYQKRGRNIVLKIPKG
ncbi:hypothetical protein N5A93_14200 [Roseovarius sp. EGI FJ00037]|uniref:hypothetical protein n=1 Tax=Roseovarius TaxID=74030 RepID=UPI0022A88555|nr:hypothetical protein [Roseovarius sp. EGI FJ00037]MCZ0813389.1 hypothetical protein [Roseovarius sp. EGI FJ00037]